MRTFLIAAGFVGVAQGFGTLCGQRSESENEWPAPTEMPANFKVALLGDQGTGLKPRWVMEMIKEWGAEMAIHDGDFEYKSDPARFIKQVNDVLGDDFPYFTSIGNHDVGAWEGPDGYEALLVERGQNWNQSAYCTGDMSVNQACYYKGLYMVLSGVGTRGSDHVQYIDEAFSAHSGADHPWKLCSWHKNQKLMQIGGKPDETGWGVYDMCRAHGAIISTGHEHSYCRSYLMSDIQNQTIVNTDNDIVLSEGQSFVHVTGLGGKSVRSAKDQLHKSPWWAAWGAIQNLVQDGALLCTFNVDGRSREAACEFRDYTGRVFDEFTMTSALDGSVDKEETQAILDNRCRSRFVEVPITRVEDDAEVSDEGVKVADSRVHSALKSTFTFRDLPFTAAEVQRLDFAHLQIMGASDGDEKEVSISISTTVEGSPSVDWTHSDEGWEKGEVWVSPDLTSLVQHAFFEGQLLTLTMEVGMAGAREFYSRDQSPCLAPTLALEFAAEECYE